MTHMLENKVLSDIINTFIQLITLIPQIIILINITCCNNLQYSISSGHPRSHCLMKKQPIKTQSAWYEWYAITHQRVSVIPHPHHTWCMLKHRLYYSSRVKLAAQISRHSPKLYNTNTEKKKTKKKLKKVCEREREGERQILNKGNSCRGENMDGAASSPSLKRAKANNWNPRALCVRCFGSKHRIELKLDWISL